MSKEEIINNIFYEKIPDEIKLFLDCPSLNRLNDVGMHCALEYTSFPFYKDLKRYSRFQHSLNVALIIYHFTSDIKQALSGLFHDIATPCFAHVIDFLNNDYEKQESTEEKTLELLNNDPYIKKHLDELNIKVDEVSNYHQYPIADNNLPHLSSDRLEYTLHNFYNYQIDTLEDIQEMYDDLIVAKNENNEDEISFKSEKIAIKFTFLALKNAVIYTTNEDRYAMEYLAHIIKEALDLKVIDISDLYTIETELITKLKNNELFKVKWNEFTSLNKVKMVDNKIDEFTYKVLSKKRIIDPYVVNKGRVSSFSKAVKHEFYNFNCLSFNCFLTKD